MKNRIEPGETIEDLLSPWREKVEELTEQLGAVIRHGNYDLESEQARADKAEAACGEIRSVLEDMHPVTNGWFDEVKHALSTDCGKGWVSPEEHERLCAEQISDLVRRSGYDENELRARIKELEGYLRDAQEIFRSHESIADSQKLRRKLGKKIDAALKSGEGE